MQQVDLAFELTRGFAAKVIRNKSKQLVGKAGIRTTDREDIEQDLRTYLFRRFSKFDSSRANWEAFVTTVVGRAAATALRIRRAKKRNRGIPPASLSDLREIDHPLWDGGLTATQFAHDLERVQMSDEMRTACERLKYESISAVARDMGISRNTLCNRLIKLREAFVEADLIKNS